MPLCIGIDLAEIEQVREAVRVHGDRYLDAVFTDAERQRCGDSAARLAASFAAKEATMKALACEERLPWRSIAVAGDEDGRPTLALSGSAAELIRQRGITALDLSVTRTASHVAAVVLGTAP